MSNYYHSAHIVSPSVYPLFLSWSILGLTSSLLVFMKSGWFINFLFFIIYFLLVVMLWLKDVSWEGLAGYHNWKVNKGFKMGFMLFVFTEVLFFFSIFWVFYDKIFIHLSVWWPVINVIVDSKGLPVLGTFILLLSSVTATKSHYNLVNNKSSLEFLVLTIVLGLVFLFIQIYEYKILGMDAGDGYYGSLFFFGTGFHGMHVFLGVVILSLCALRMFMGQFNKSNHLMFEAAVIYWHFVDVVWLFLYLVLYTTI